MSNFSKFIPPIEEDEKYFIAYCLKNPQELNLLSEHQLNSSQAKQVYKTIETLYKESITLFDIDLIKRNNIYVEREYLDSLFRIRLKDKEHLKYCLKNIKDYPIKMYIGDTTEKFLTQITQKGDLNYDTIRQLANELLYNSVKLDNDTSLRTYKELTASYREVLQKRIQGEGKKSLGFKSIDKIVIRPGAVGEMTTLFGAKGSGKCVKFSTLILSDKGFEKIGTYSKNIKGFSDLSCSLITKNGEKKSNKFFEEEVDYYYEIKTKFGYTLGCTATHPLYSFNENCDYNFVNTELLKTGSILPIMQNTKKFNNNPQEIIYDDFKFKGNPNQECQIKRMKVIPQYLNKGLSRFLGYYVANGIMFREIASYNNKIKNDIECILNELSITYRRNSEGIFTSQKEFQNFIKYLHGYPLDIKSCTARFKEVPKFILEGTEENQIEFLKALFDCDSSLNKDISLDYYTASQNLATQIQLMLLNLGIFSFIKEKYLKEYDHTYYTVHISSEDFDKYKELINYESLKYDFKKNKIKRNTNIKTIPYIKEFIDKEILSLRHKLNVSPNGTFKYNNDKGRFTVGLYSRIMGSPDKITYKSLNNIYLFFKEEKEFHKYQEIQNIIIKIEEILNNNYIYDSIIDIKIVKEKIKVYDFHIPEAHNFYSNGMISHNSLIGKCIENMLVNSNVCVVSINLEMTEESNMDRKISVATNYTLEQLLDSEFLQSEENIQFIEDSLLRLEERKNYIYYSEPEMNLDQLDKLLFRSRQYFGDNHVLPKDGYMFITSDLTEQVEELSGKAGTDLKPGVNRLLQITKKYNSHKMNILQSNENIFRAGRMLGTPESCDNFSIQTEHVEGGAVYAARSRVVLAVNRPLLLKRKFFPQRNEEWDLEEDILWLNVTKQNDGKLGRTPFIFSDNSFRLVPYKIDNTN